MRNNGDGSPIITVCNMTPIVRDNYRIGVPIPGSWQEIFNTDAVIYGGGGVTNAGELITQNQSMHGCSQCLELRLPPLACIFLGIK